jgi:hypothetical protein
MIHTLMLAYTLLAGWHEPLLEYKLTYVFVPSIISMPPKYISIPPSPAGMY